MVQLVYNFSECPYCNTSKGKKISKFKTQKQNTITRCVTLRNINFNYIVDVCLKFRCNKTLSKIKHQLFANHLQQNQFFHFNASPLLILYHRNPLTYILSIYQFLPFVNIFTITNKNSFNLPLFFDLQVIFYQTSSNIIKALR